MVQVVPALGAEQMVAFCGGIYAVLMALRVDVRAAFLPEGLQFEGYGKAQGLVPVAFPWEQYGAVVTALRKKGRDRPDLLGKAGTIPDSALKAMRCGMLRPFDRKSCTCNTSREDKAWTSLVASPAIPGIPQGISPPFSAGVIDACRGQRQVLGTAEVDARLESMPASLAKGLLPFQTGGRALWNPARWADAACR